MLFVLKQTIFGRKDSKSIIFGKCKTLLASRFVDVRENTQSIHYREFSTKIKLKDELEMSQRDEIVYGDRRE